SCVCVCVLVSTLVSHLRTPGFESPVHLAASRVPSPEGDAPGNHNNRRRGTKPIRELQFTVRVSATLQGLLEESS
ncbi:hypothetical protein O3P69_011692, partial [Scylla paramamosain]